MVKFISELFDKFDVPWPKCMVQIHELNQGTCSKRKLQPSYVGCVFGVADKYAQPAGDGDAW